jgi:hypothetical protein
VACNVKVGMWNWEFLRESFMRFVGAVLVTLTDI